MPDTDIVMGGDLSSSKRLSVHETREQLEDRMRKWVVIVILSLFSASNSTTLALFIWKAIAAHGSLEDRVLLYLAGTNLSQCAAVLLLATKFLFRSKEKDR